MERHVLVDVVVTLSIVALVAVFFAALFWRITAEARRERRD